MALKPNYYETLYVVRPDLKEEELSKIQSKLPQFIEAHEGEIMKSDKWAERELAYEILDHKRGVYYILVFKALPTVTRDIEKHLRFYNTDVLRFMTVKITEEVAVREKNAAEEKSSSAEPEAPATPPAETAQASEAPAQPATAEEPKSETAETAADQPETPQETAEQPQAQEQEATKEETTEPQEPEAATEVQSAPETAEKEGGKE